MGLPHSGAMRPARACVEQTHVVVDFGDRADGGSGVLAGRLLLDGNGRGEALDRIHVRLVHLLQELPGVGGQGLHVPPLPLRIEGVERQGGLPGAADPRDDDELVPGNLRVDVLQVVLAGALDDDLSLSHWPRVPLDGSSRRREDLQYRRQAHNAKARPRQAPPLFFRCVRLRVSRTNFPPSTACRRWPRGFLRRSARPSRPSGRPRTRMPRRDRTSWPDSSTPRSTAPP